MNTTHAARIVGTAATSKTVHLWVDDRPVTWCHTGAYGKTLHTEEVTAEQAKAKVTCKRCAVYL